MKTKPFSFKVFLVLLLITAGVFIAATLLSQAQADKKYATILAFFLFVAMSFSPVGIYAGLKDKSNNQKTYNRIGIYGNLLFYVFILFLMIGGLYMAVS